MIQCQSSPCIVQFFHEQHLKSVQLILQPDPICLEKQRFIERFKNRIFKEVDTPFILRVMLLGDFWGVLLLFMVNIFYKASMHTSAAGGFLGVMIVLLMINPVNMVLPLFVSLLICGIIGTARLLTGAHKPAEIWVGYGLGIIVQVAAYLYLL